MEELNEAEKEKLRKLYEGNQDTFLSFSVNKKTYAFKTSLIQEIIYGAKIHVIPFTPDYVEGVLNCRGTPYTVINTLKMEAHINSSQNKTASDSNLDIKESIFLLFKRSDDQFCIRISNIEDFFELEEDDVFEDKIKYKMRFIPIFDADRVEEILCQDLGKED